MALSSSYRRLRRGARRLVNRRGRRVSAAAGIGVRLAGRRSDRFHDTRQDWAILVASVTDVREITERAVCPWEMTVLDRRAVTSCDASFVADPFLFHHGEAWYLFCEVWDRALGRGVIGAATSRNGEHWEWLGEVLREDFHLSYPNVVADGGRIFMIPETNAAGSVRLYEAVSFPFRWEFVGELFSHPNPVDPTVFAHDGRWWCFLDGSLRSDRLELHCAERLAVGENWKPHPQSPLVLGDQVRARPAGLPLVIDGVLHRVSQAKNPRYGTAVRAHRIDVLDDEHYADDRWGSILLHPSGRGPNRSGSHHISAVGRPDDDRLLVAFDGY